MPSGRQHRSCSTIAGPHVRLLCEMQRMHGEGSGPCCSPAARNAMHGAHGLQAPACSRDETDVVRSWCIAQVDRIQMASSGVLLMLSADHDGTITDIRSRFHACAPGMRRPVQLLLLFSPACLSAWRDGQALSQHRSCLSMNFEECCEVIGGCGVATCCAYAASLLD